MSYTVDVSKPETLGDQLCRENPGCTVTRKLKDGTLEMWVSAASTEPVDNAVTRLPTACPK